MPEAGGTDHPPPERRMTRTDPELIKAFLSGDRDSVRLVESWIRSVINNKGWCHALDIDDIRQDTIQTLLINLQNGSYRGGSLHSYVINICLHKCIDVFRQVERRQRHEQEQPPDANYEHPGIEHRMERDDRIRLARSVLRNLDPACRELIVEVYLHQVRQQDLAESMGVGYGALRKRLHDCMKRVHEIRRRLDDDA